MLILVIGANNSGKSACAESIAARAGGEKIYVATMIPDGEEGSARVEKHRKQRAGMGFTTIECPRRLENLEVRKDALVLLEDASNLLGNALFDRETPACAGEIFGDIKNLNARCGALIVVTIGGLTPDGWESETKAFIQALNWLNARLCEAADAVIEMRRGAPHLRKGECPWF